jgi:hypothetical protein
MSSVAQYLLWDDCSLIDKVRDVFPGKSYMYHLPCSIELILAGIDVLDRCTFANTRRVTSTHGVSNPRPRATYLHDLFRLSRYFFGKCPHVPVRLVRGHKTTYQDASAVPPPVLGNTDLSLDSSRFNPVLQE